MFARYHQRVPRLPSIPLRALVLLCATCGPDDGSPTPAECLVTTPTIATGHGLALVSYHFDVERTGWNDAEDVLSPANAASLAPAWCGPALASATVDGVSFAPHLYASPLFVDDVAIRASGYEGLVTSVVFVATSNGDAYAIAAADGDAATSHVSTGTILWRTHLSDPAQPKSTDGVPVGVLGTPTIDLGASPPRLYVTSADASRGWLAYALDLGTGLALPGWPVVLDPAVIAAQNANASTTAPATFADVRTVSQRGALSLSRDAAHLYVGFGSYYDGAIGWMVAIDTRAARIEASMSGSPSDVSSADGNEASAGMWGAGGVVVDAQGRAFVTTGNSPATSASAPGVWGNSVLAWTPPLVLSQTYTPYNYCALDAGDTDLGGSSPIVFDLDPSVTATPHLAAFGSKQGNVYLIDRDALGGRLDARSPCDVANLPSPETDGSLYGPEARAYYSPPSRGPLNVFGPYSDAPDANELNNAKMRTSPALFRDTSGATFLFVSGNARDPSNLASVVPPSLARLRVVTSAGAPAYLALDASAANVVFKNPGPPVVTSFHSQSAIVWVLDENAKRTDALVPSATQAAPTPILYAFDASTLALLWQTTLPAPGGKYNHATIAHGTVYVGADRLYAFRAP